MRGQDDVIARIRVPNITSTPLLLDGVGPYNFSAERGVCTTCSPPYFVGVVCTNRATLNSSVGVPLRIDGSPPVCTRSSTVVCVLGGPESKEAPPTN